MTEIKIAYDAFIAVVDEQRGSGCELIDAHNAGLVAKIAHELASNQLTRGDVVQQRHHADPITSRWQRRRGACVIGNCGTCGYYKSVNEAFDQLWEEAYTAALDRSENKKANARMLQERVAATLPLRIEQLETNMGELKARLAALQQRNLDQGTPVRSIYCADLACAKLSPCCIHM